MKTGVPKTLTDLLDQMLRCTTPDGVRSLLTSIGDRADLELGQTFGPFSLQWRPFGDRESNISSIGLGTKAGRSLTERITNAQDAVLDAEARRRSKGNLPASPWQAAEQWFGRPPPGNDRGTHGWENEKIDRNIQLLLLDSGDQQAPTVDVLDHGIGIRPEDFANTILSLQAGNKIKNRHLIGAFGQGGAATLAFCDYTMVFSRQREDPSRVGFTIIRVLRLSEQYKEDCYCYLSVKDAVLGQFCVPFAKMKAEDPLPVHPHVKDSKAAILGGTLVRHVAYKLVGLEKGLGPSPGNLWHYLHVSMFDPILPFRVVDLRPNGKNRVISGSRNRLLKLLTHQKQETVPTDEEESGSSIRLYRPLEFIKPHGASDSCVGIEYWVVTNLQKRKDAPAVLRARSSELFVLPRYPIVGTLNGQNQGELSSRVVAECGLQMVSQHIVVHIDASKADSRVRRELFATNREGFKEGLVLESIVKRLQELLEEDEELHELERELTEKLVARENQETKSEVKKQVQKLLLDAGLALDEEGAEHTSGHGEEDQTKKRRRRKYKRAEDLPTLPYPNVTKFEMVYPKSQALIPTNDYQGVLVETDADSSYDAQIRVRSEPDVLEEIGRVPLRGGRVRWRLRPKVGTEVGVTGQIIASLTKPDGKQLTAQVAFETTAPIEEKSKQSTGRVPPFEIVPIEPGDEKWPEVWPDLADQELASSQLRAVSYRIMQLRGKLFVYYSTVFEPFKAQCELYKAKGAADSLSLFALNYEIWIGYHAILQFQASRVGCESIEEEVRATLEQQERDRVARMQVNQARRVTEIQKQVVKGSSVGLE